MLYINFPCQNKTIKEEIFSLLFKGQTQGLERLNDLSMRLQRSN